MAVSGSREIIPVAIEWEGWVGSRGDLDVFEETEASCPCGDSNPGSSSPYPKKLDNAIGMNLSMLQFHIRRNVDGIVNK